MALPENFCIIESPESVKDFATLQVGAAWCSCSLPRRRAHPPGFCAA